MLVVLVEQTAHLLVLSFVASLIPGLLGNPSSHMGNAVPSSEVCR